MKEPNKLPPDVTCLGSYQTSCRYEFDTEVAAPNGRTYYLRGHAYLVFTYDENSDGTREVYLDEICTTRNRYLYHVTQLVKSNPDYRKRLEDACFESLLSH